MFGRLSRRAGLSAIAGLSCLFLASFNFSMFVIFHFLILKTLAKIFSHKQF